MKQPPSRFPIYSRLLRLYPQPYRQAYEKDILQTTEDMLYDCPSRLTRLGLWLRIALNLPASLTVQHLQYAAYELRHETPRYIKMNSLFSGVLLLPFFIAALANGLDGVVYGHTLYNSWLWSTPALATWVLRLPLLALLVAVSSYLYFIAASSRRHGIRRPTRLLDLAHTWPILALGAIATGIFLMLLFHDGAQCWLHNPAYVVAHVRPALQCSFPDASKLSHGLIRELF